MTSQECWEILTILLQLGMAFLAIPTCLVASAMLLIKLIKMLAEDVR